MHVNARAIVERSTPNGIEILVQIRNKPYEGGEDYPYPQSCFAVLDRPHDSVISH